MNVELLLKVKAKILEEPRQFVMWTFFLGDNSTGSIPTIPNCGTAACIAGWAIALNAKLSPKEARLLGDELGDGEMLGRSALGIGSKQAGELFYTDSWPEPFRARWNEQEHYLGGGDPKIRAQIAADRIDAFIEEHKERA